MTACRSEGFESTVVCVQYSSCTCACSRGVKLTCACSQLPDHASGCSLILNTESEVSMEANLFITEAVMFKWGVTPYREWLHPYITVCLFVCNMNVTHLRTLLHVLFSNLCSWRNPLIEGAKALKASTPLEMSYSGSPHHYVCHSVQCSAVGRIRCSKDFVFSDWCSGAH